MDDSDQAYRAICYCCFRPETHCMCRAVTPIKASRNIVVLQHPNERKKYHATAKLLKAWIQNCKVLRGVQFSKEYLQSQCIDFELEDAVLLFPRNDQENLVTDQTGFDTLIVLDGTWSQARKIFNQNPWLQQLPRVQLTDPRVSQYKIRKQPKLGFISTLEAVSYFMLGITKEEGGSFEPYLNLLSGFEQMVRQQIDSIQDDELRSSLLEK